MQKSVFARILAKRLGRWEVAVLHHHNTSTAFGLGSRPSRQCFPHAFPAAPNVEPDLASYLNFSDSTKHDLNDRFFTKKIQYWRFRANVRRRIESLGDATWLCYKHACNYSEPALSGNVHPLLRHNSQTRFIYLSTMFLHYD